jgi:hypothetical protein
MSPVAQIRLTQPMQSGSFLDKPKLPVTAQPKIGISEQYAKLPTARHERRGAFHELAIADQADQPQGRVVLSTNSYSILASASPEPNR